MSLLVARQKSPTTPDRGPPGLRPSVSGSRSERGAPCACLPPATRRWEPAEWTVCTGKACRSRRRQYDLPRAGRRGQAPSGGLLAVCCSRRGFPGRGRGGGRPRGRHAPRRGTFREPPAAPALSHLFLESTVSADILVSGPGSDFCSGRLCVPTNACTRAPVARPRCTVCDRGAECVPAAERPSPARVRPQWTPVPLVGRFLSPSCTRPPCATWGPAARGLSCPASFASPGFSSWRCVFAVRAAACRLPIVRPRTFGLLPPLGRRGGRSRELPRGVWAEPLCTDVCLSRCVWLCGGVPLTAAVQPPGPSPTSFAAAPFCRACAGPGFSASLPTPVTWVS